ncbi:hypothetical protein SDC9_127870 [bioreactor metagenome]|uniref:Formyl-CoA transferase n=1 Tax=bioreactor metagenome TaxID=1076179 RepID=A0A645CUK6_9ZZZZ
MKVNGCPVKLMDTKPTLRTPAPLLGEYNEDFYEGIMNMSNEELCELKVKGII